MKNTFKICIGIIILGMSSNAFAQTIPTYIPLNGLVAWWPFNGNAIDESVNSNDGTVNGPTLIADRYGNSSSAYLWNSSPDKIIVASNSQTQLTDTFTVSVWIMPINGTYGSGPNYHAIVEKWGSGGDASYLMGLRPNGIPFFSTHDGPSTTGLDASQIIPQNVWSNIVFTLSNDTGHLYINGVLDTARTGMANPLLMNNDLIFGSNDSYNGGWAGDAFEGIIDDIGMWDRALSPNEVLTVYQSDSLTGTSEIAAYSDQLTLFPNPANELLQLTFKTKNILPYEISIYNIAGQRIFNKVFETPSIGTQKPNVPLTDFQNGIYLIRVEFGDVLLSQKIIIAN